MARKTDLEDILFPVELKPVFVEIGEGLSMSKKIVPQSQAIVNAKTGHILGVVSKEYSLITNQDAIELGKQCCQKLFGLNVTASLQVFNVLAPSTGSYCHIDLIHSGFTMNLLDSPSKPEIYIPFVRVTNSYNTTRALRFDVGFCRKICLNGAIFESETVHFIYSHIRHEIGRPIQFDIEKERFDKFKENFVAFMNILRNLPVPKEKGRFVFNVVLRIPREQDIDTKKKAEYLDLKEYAVRKIDKYYDDLGENAYALFNAITDMASNPPENKLFRRDVNSMQRLAGNWVNDLKERINKNDFNLDSYIKELLKQYEQGNGKN